MSAGAREIGRNDPCRCGSGKKYKRCCMKADAARTAAAVEEPDGEDLLAQALEEPVEVAQSWFDYDDEDEDAVRALFEGIHGVRPDGGGWVLTGYLDERDGVPFAWVRMGEGAVQVISTYGSLLMSARSFIEVHDHDGVLYHMRTNVSDVPVTLQMLRDEEHLEDAEDAVRDLLWTTMRCYYERWIHAGNRALDGRSPLEVAKGKHGPRLELLYGILTLLDEHERSCPWIDGLACDFDEVWRMLQIDRERVLGPAAAEEG